ncbi:IS66 family insertion sequence element accessory protein TnpA [Clostridium tagluense]|uniref:IS66 family insertion sequence element accessory protein TnpA n=1 Tax=Clostridium tagluense TaxID=360422 RepID=UPI001C6ECA08|nr:hypothetical protein [Clostridium tagluense]MBW9159738.1 hypothetical protein [Clostridium tagluense]WLC63641.1 hypothetical protein KTC93_12145 [Clostridium tagluense]WLC63721.1 hypothetical protein KTC93_12570 [Clostridium tagluense]WLC67443.1 hypothetical protein KTC93_09850 [Clostridium tagluense]WLC68308.1 hypothetical protein KTC93_25400 [Clostridium tagluense]
MAKKFNDVRWRGFLEKFSSYEGTVTSFCKKNNISKSQFYYYKSKLEQSSKPTFHAIAISNKESNPQTVNNSVKGYNDIRIEIGKANIYIPANEIALLSNILKELSKSC